MTTSTLSARLPVRPTPADELRAIALRVSRLGVGRLTSPTPRSRHRCWAMRELRSQLGRHQPERIDAEADKRTGWRKHSILVVAEQEPRLTRSARELVRPLNAKLYSRRKEAPDD